MLKFHLITALNINSVILRSLSVDIIIEAYIFSFLIYFINYFLRLTPNLSVSFCKQILGGAKWQYLLQSLERQLCSTCTVSFRILAIFLSLLRVENFPGCTYFRKRTGEPRGITIAPLTLSSLNILKKALPNSTYLMFISTCIISFLVYCCEILKIK